MAERSIQEIFKGEGLTVRGGEPVVAPSRIQVNQFSGVQERQQQVTNEIIRGFDEAKFTLDATGMRLFLSQGIGAKGILEFPKTVKGPWTDDDGEPKRAFMTVHPDSSEEAGIIRLKVFTSPTFWTNPDLDPRKGEVIDQEVDDVIGASVTLGRGAHKSDEKAAKRDTVETTQPAHTALVLATSFSAGRPLEKTRKLSPTDAPHLVDNELKPGASGFTPDLASFDANDPRALTDNSETIYPPININRMEQILATGGQNLRTNAEKAEYKFYAFFANCNSVVQIGSLNAQDLRKGELILPRATDPESVVVYQAELFVGLARKGEAAVSQAIKTMTARKNLTNW